MEELDLFYERCLDRGLCAKYVRRWEKLKSKEDTIRLALTHDSIEWLIKAKREGWGLDNHFWETNFPEYINGTLDECCMIDDYIITANMYVNYNERGKHDLCGDIVHISDSKSTFIVTDFMAHSIYVSGNSSITINILNDSNISLYVYDNSSVRIKPIGDNSNVIVYKHDVSNVSIVESDYKIDVKYV